MTLKNILAPTIFLVLTLISQSSFSQENQPYYFFNIGSFSAAVISDGMVTFPALPNYAPTANAMEVEKSKRDHFQDPKNIDLYSNPLYVDTGKNKILFDVGAGFTLGPTMGKFFKNLKKAGIDPLKIDSIFITHGHLDHIGGLTNPKTGASRFPNAKIYLSQEEWSYWSGGETDLSMLNIPQEFKDLFKATAKTNLKALSTQVHPFKPGAVNVIPGVSAIENTWGHTPGHVVYRVSSGDSELLVMGDTMFNEAFDISHPNWQTAFDWKPKKAEEVRKKLLLDSAADRTLVHIYHIAFPALGHLKASGQTYDWVPLSYKFQMTKSVGSGDGK